MNNVSLIGRLTRDPESVETNNGTAITNIRIAIDRQSEDDSAIFVDVKTFGKQAMACAGYLEKGRQVAVSGRLELDEWLRAGGLEKGPQVAAGGRLELDEGLAADGTKRSRYYVVGERIEFLARPRSND